MRKAFAIVLVVAGLGMVAFGFSALASAGTTGNVSVTFTVPSFQNLTLDTTTIQFGTVNPGTTGNTPTGPTNPGTGNPYPGPTITVQSNVNYKLSYTVAADFTGTGSLPPTIDIGNLKYNGTSFVVGTVDIVTNGTPTGGTDHLYNYTLDVPGDAAPDDYSASIMYTLSTPD